MSAAVLTRKYVSIAFPKTPPFTFSVTCEQTDKYAIVMFANRDISSRTRSYYNTGTGESLRRAFQNASGIISTVVSSTRAAETARAAAGSDEERQSIPLPEPPPRKVYGIATKLYATAVAAEEAEKYNVKHTIHEIY